MGKLTFGLPCINDFCSKRKYNLYVNLNWIYFFFVFNTFTILFNLLIPITITFTIFLLWTEINYCNISDCIRNIVFEKKKKKIM